VVDALLGLSRLVLAPLLLLAGVMAARAQEPSRAERDYAARAAALIAPYVEAGLFSGTILVAQNGKPLFRRAFGPANREWGIANTLDTHFRIGSLTKGFTAAAILKLAEAGRLDLADPVGRHVPGLPAAWEKVSLRDLLRHSSGIINFTALANYIPEIARTEHGPRELVALTESEPLLFEPGARFEYSNTNYILLGMVIEAASGRPYAEYLREAILAPLGLKETGYDDATALLPRRASGYRRGQAQWRNATPMASSATWAAGGLYATADDLLTWTEALVGGRLLSAASLEQTFADEGRGYGLGWYVGRAHDRRLWSHGGSVFGFISSLDHYPDERLTVVILANTETAPVQKISRELAALRFGIFDPPQAIVLEDVILDRYVGSYRLGPRFFLTIAREGDHLTAQGTGQAAFALLPESDRTFFSKVVDARLTFETEPDGRPTGVILRQGGLDRLGPRIDPEEAKRALAAPKPEHREVAIEPERLRAHAGRYMLAPGFAISVTFADGRLYAQATGQARNPLYAEGPRTFFLKAVDAQITFTADAAGRTTGLVLHQNGLDTAARRIEPAETARAAPRKR